MADEVDSILGAPAALSSVPGKPFARVALSVGLPVGATGREIVDHLVAARHRPGVKPVPVAREDAEVKQNVLLGDDADLTRFPVPFVHSKDGDRYVNTYGVIVEALLPAPGERDEPSDFRHAYPADVQAKVLRRYGR